MKLYCRILTVITSVLIAGMIGCSETDETSSDTAENPMIENPEAGGSDEESAVQLALTDTYDHTRNGARLILNYDAATNTFKGTVENTTNAVLPQVRVEIHLFNSQGSNPPDPELGPTPPVDLAPGQKIPIELIALDEPFDMWVAHPEVGGSEGGGEHGEGGEHGGEGGHN